MCIKEARLSELLEQVLGRPRAAVPELWEAQVARIPSRPFLVWEGREWTYAQAWGEIGAMANLLRSVGVAPGGRVASYLSNRPEALWTWFGAQLAGAVHVAINREQRGPLLADLLHRSDAEVLVTEAEALQLLPADIAQRVVVVEENELEPAMPD